VTKGVEETTETFVKAGAKTGDAVTDDTKVVAKKIGEEAKNLSKKQLKKEVLLVLGLSAAAVGIVGLEFAAAVVVAGTIATVVLGPTAAIWLAIHSRPAHNSYWEIKYTTDDSEDKAVTK
jgi:hypothetical protein